MSEAASKPKAPVKAPARRAPRARPEPAATLPVARICVDLPLAHLDRPFDYLVPTTADADAVPGSRVRVRFAGQLVDGYLLERVEDSAHGGKLAFLERVVSSEPVLHPETARLARAVADRYGGTLADVLRLAVPPRHARAETKADAAPVDTEAPPPPDQTGWSAYPAGAAFLRAVADGRPARAVWSALPGEDWPARLAEAAAAADTAGRGAVLVVADARDLDRLDAALGRVLGPGRHVALSAALGPEERYRRFLAASRGRVRVVAGTRAAAFAPVEPLGLVAIWDDGDDLHAEPRSPYPHAREVLLTRSQLAGCAALVGGFARSAEAQQLVETGWAKEIAATREDVRRAAPHVQAVGDDVERDRDPAAASARLPSIAWRAAREALAAGAPVLVQVPRRGYLPSVACADCHTPARCPSCSGPLALREAAGAPGCRWCGKVAAAYSCPHCGGRRLRASVVGARRTAEELGRAFPGTPVRTSGRDGVLASVPAQPALVVSTPGAEPVAEGGYGAVLLLDTWALLTRADLRASEETMRRWLAAAALARPARTGGRVVIAADAGIPTVQALVRWDPAGLAARELAERRELAFPPTVRFASLTGVPDAVAEMLAAADLPPDAELLGPVPAADPDSERMLVRVPRSAGRALAAALHAAAGVRSAKKARDPVRVQVDPLELL
ncbi:primosomal protein N' [Planosporangium mesophilum]|uniref:Probable replication restart protein PriA n=1 Tax=Planosporangium mesophilum TaxID=689768 RepID=A0A8J3TF50_9ACTN|nr:primosomal protein N' [Planosporangium mesophilum]NJC85231.1 primosomal protein N' [Planosporangium mesophilum]GII24376.1 putative primosomal protein N' [Planosporangium mesophilum]